MNDWLTLAASIACGGWNSLIEAALRIALNSEAAEAQIYELLRKDPDKPHGGWLIRDDERRLTVFEANGHGPGVHSYVLIQGDQTFRVFTENHGYSGIGKKTAHLRIYDTTLRDETGVAVEGDTAAALKALIKEGISTYIQLRNPTSIGSVDVEFGSWVPPAPGVAPTQPVPFRMPWVELIVVIVGLAIAAAWIGAELRLL